MKLNIAVVDDDKNSRDVLCEYIKRYSEETGCFISLLTFSDGEEILFDYKSEFDIIFLDIMMKNLDGMSTAEQIRKCDSSVILIFVTNMASFAVKGYAVEAFNYLLKPVTYYVFKHEMDRSVGKLNSRISKYITLANEKAIVKIEVSDILYIERIKNKLVFRTKENDFESKGTIKEMEKELSDWNFFRSNNCYLVNLAHVTAIEATYAVIGTNKLLISRPRKKAFLEALTAYFGGIKK